MVGRKAYIVTVLINKSVLNVKFLRKAKQPNGKIHSPSKGVSKNNQGGSIPPLPTKQASSD